MSLRIAGLVGCALLLTGGAGAAFAQSSVTLQVGCYGGAFTDAAAKYAGAPYTRRTGVRSNGSTAIPAITWLK
jgi:hypothetical protein